MSLRGRWEELTGGVAKWVCVAARGTAGPGSLHGETVGECVGLIFFCFRAVLYTVVSYYDTATCFIEGRVLVPSGGVSTFPGFRKTTCEEFH